MKSKSAFPKPILVLGALIQLIFLLAFIIANVMQGIPSSDYLLGLCILFCTLSCLVLLVVMGRDIYLGPDSTKWDTFYVLSVLFWVVGIVAGWFAFSNQFGVNLVQYANTYGWSAWLKFEPLYGLIYFSFWVSIACVGVVVLGLVLRKVDSWSGLNVLPGWWERFCIQLDKIKAVTKRVREKRPPVVVEPLVAVSAVRPMAS